MEQTTSRRPALVMLAAALLGLLAIWRFAVKVVPAFIAGDPDGFGEFISVAFSVAVIVGLLALQRWAWWFAVITTGAVTAIIIAVLGSFDRIPLEGYAVDRVNVVRALSVLGAVSAVILGCLIAPSSRAVFRKRP